MPSVQTKYSDTDMKHQNYFWLPNTVEFVARGTTYACGKHFNVLTLPVRRYLVPTPSMKGGGVEPTPPPMISETETPQPSNLAGH